jgi:LCP family protein required for cell wall assembly
MRGALLRYLAGALIITLAAGAGVAIVTLRTVTAMGVGPIVRDLPTRAPKSGDPQTILLVGSDRRYGAAGDDARADTMMLVRLDPAENAISVLSIPRDLRVRVPGLGPQKINAAYGAGGLKLVTSTVRSLLSTPGQRFEINHAVGVTFGGFEQAIDRVGCVYVDVDRRYFHSNAGLPAAQQYAEIDLQPGYQRLCGGEALDFARFRHLDNDLVRAARQQSLLRDVRDQVGASGLIGNGTALARIAARSSETDADLRSFAGIERIAKLARSQAGDPVRQLTFPATLGASDVTTSRARVAQVVKAFLHPAAPAKRAARRGAPAATAKTKQAPPRLLPFTPTVSALVRFPVYLPTRLVPGSRVEGPPRAYAIRDPAGHVHQAYRFVVSENRLLGQYYGVQGTTWRTPPLLRHVDARRRVGGRTYLLVKAGARTRYVAWKTRSGVYWVANTLTMTLGDDQLLAVARSLQRVS